MNPLPPLNINDADLFVPNVEKMMRSYRVVVPTGETRAIIVPRQAYVIAETVPAPTEIEYTFGEPNDATAQDVWDKSVAGYFYASGRGRWIFKHNSATSVVFLVKDAGGAAAGDAAAAPSIPSSLDGRLLPLTLLAPAVNADIDAASEEVVAARVGRRYLYVENTSAGGQVLWLAFGNPAVVGSGIRLSPGQFLELTAMGNITEQAVNAIADAANGSASYQEGT